MPWTWARHHLEEKGVIPLNKGNKEGNIVVSLKQKEILGGKRESRFPCSEKRLLLQMLRD